jgi:plastocyanin
MTASLLLLVGTSPVLAYHEEAVESGGVIAGQVRVLGEVPRLPPYEVYKHKELWGVTAPDERSLVGENGASANDVVYLKEVWAGKPIDVRKPVVLDNKNCAFVPHVLSATVGQTLEIYNSDPFLHDAHARIGPKTLFNRAIMHGKSARELLREPGLVQLNCNVRHTWMQAYLFVADHPYHVVTSVDGKFRIEGVPPGKYQLEVWHEMLGGGEREIAVEAGKTTTLDIELRAEAK